MCMREILEGIWCPCLLATIFFQGPNKLPLNCTQNRFCIQKKRNLERKPINQEFSNVASIKSVARLNKFWTSSERERADQAVFNWGIYPGTHLEFTPVLNYVKYVATSAL